MTPLAEAEFGALRATIRERGTARLLLFFCVVAVWAALALAAVVLSVPPAGALIPLLVLVAGFEAVHALHIGVERIGRYLQVHYEGRGTDQDPAWETTAMSFGRQFPRSGPDPLFSAIFLVATVVNLLPVITGTTIEILTLTAAHAWLPLRILVTRRRAARQRAEDLERFRQLAGRSEPAT
jgi:hypothetical protein